MNQETPNDRSLDAKPGEPEVSGAALWLAWARRGEPGAGASGAGGLSGGFAFSRGGALSSGCAFSRGGALSAGMSAASMGLLARACSRGGVVLHDGRRAAAAAMLAFALQMAAAPARAGEQITIPPDNDYPITIGIGGDYDTMTVNNGGTATSTTIFVSGTQIVQGGSANITIIDGGNQKIVGGGKATNTTINVGGVQEVGTGGGSANITTINFGGHQSVDGGPATSTTINSGGSQTVWHDGTATSTTVNVGGQQVITSGGSAATTTVKNGGQQVVIWGQATGTTVSGGGSQHVSSFTSGDYSGSGTVIDTILDGGTQVIDNGGAASATTINNGGQQYVNSGGKVLAGSGLNSSATVVNSGGQQHIASGGEAAGVTIADGGKQYVSKGGTATDVTVNSGGVQDFAAGGLISGGSNTIQGTAKGGTVISGAVQTLKGGSASGTVVSGTQVVDSGGTAQNVKVLAGGPDCGQKVVYGTATSTTISSGGYQHVSAAAAGSAGVASNATVLSGGTQVVGGGGTATATTVNKGGAMNVEGGGTANQVTLAGGALTMAAGASGAGTLQGHGAVSAAALNVGGANNFASVIVSSGALRATNSLQVNSGGTVTVNSGGTLSAGGALDVADNGAVTVSGGGVLSAASVSAAATATVSLSGGTLAATGAIDLRQGLTGARGNVRAGTELRIAGATQASGALNLYAGTNLVPTGAIDVNLVSAGGDVGDAGNRQNLTAVTVVAGGKVAAHDLAAANLSATSLDATGDVTLTNGNARVTGDAVVAGTFAANGGNVRVGGTLDAADLQISGGGLVAAQDLALDGHTATVTSGGLTIGSSDNTEMQKALKKAGASAGLSIAKPTDVSGSTGKIMVGAGAADPGAGGVAFASQTTLDVNAAAAQGKTPILKAKTLNIANGVTLSVSDIAGAKTFTAYQAETVTGAFAAVVTDSVFFMGILNPDGTVRLEQVPTGELMPKMDSDLAALLTSAAMNGEIGTDDAHVFSQHGGARLLSRAISREYLGGDLERASVTIEGVARGAAAGGVPQMAFAIARAGAGAVGERLGALGAARVFPLAAPDGAVSQAAGGAPVEDYASYGGPGLAIWGMPLYQNWNAHGLPAGGYDLDGWGWLAGGAVGADWTFDRGIRLGAAFDFGAGFAQGGGDFNRTLNDMSFWGVNLYGGWKPGAFGVFADVGFSSGWNRFRQNLPPELQMADLEAGIASWALSTGLRAEYEFHTDIIDAIPHVGVRYSHLKTEQYSLKSAGLTVLEGDAICQNVWSLPIGVTFARNFALGRGWALRLSVDARITPNMGDVDARGGVSFTGVSGQTELRTQVMDYVLFGGTAGAELRKGERLRLGAHYDFEVGDHSAQHGVFATLTWRF